MVLMKNHKLQKLISFEFMCLIQILNLDKMKNYPRGSEWRIWDLHVHTPASYDYKDKSISNNDIINSLVANNISVVAITDHHTIDIRRIQELQVIAESKNITILPGIEFCSELGGNQAIHFIGIFSERANLILYGRKSKDNVTLRMAKYKKDMRKYIAPLKQHAI